MPWLRLRAAASASAADPLSQQLRTAGAVAVSLLPGQDADELHEPAPGEETYWPSVAIEALLPLDADLAALPHLDFDIDFLADRDWSRTWREGFGPMRFGRLIVMPQDSVVHPAADEVAVRLDPGLAFGTGTHTTTALCLDWLAAQPLAGRRVLDVGCGSGILAIAALALGAHSAAAIDHDPQARLAAARNAASNNVAFAIENDLAMVRDHFDIAVANIVANVHCELAPHLETRADTLALSGILPGQVERVMSAFRGFQFQPPAIKDGWVLLCGRRA